jgi:hypothetical protein
MTTNRLYALFGLITLLALGLVGALMLPVVAQPPAASPVSAAAAEQARLAQRHGEWFAGEENIYAPLDLHDRHPSAAASDPEILRFVAYANGLAEQARLAQRRGEWFAGESDPEIQRFILYSSSLAEQARLDQRRGEWYAGQ